MNNFLYKNFLNVLIIFICVNVLFSQQDSSIILGCTNSFANNFNPSATDDDGNCEFGFEIEFNDSTLTDFSSIYNLNVDIETINFVNPFFIPNDSKNNTWEKINNDSMLLGSPNQKDNDGKEIAYYRVYIFTKITPDP